MSFFIRGKNKNLNAVSKKRKSKLDVPYSKKKKKIFSGKIPNGKDEEISSEEEILESTKGREEEFEEEQITVQEKKLLLAKKYLSEVEDEEKERLDSGEVDSKIIANRLREGVLEQEGKLKKRIGDTIITELSKEDIHILRCKDHKLSITCVVLSSDNKFIFSGSKDCSIVKWCLSSFKKVKAIPPKHKRKDDNNLHSSPILALAVSPDDKYLASSSSELDVRLWSAETLEHFHTFKGHRGPVTGLVFCKFTGTLFSCSSDKTVKLWSPIEKAYLETLFGHQNGVTSIDSLCKDRAVTAGGTDDSLRVWKIKEECHLIFNGHTRSVDGVTRLNNANFISCGDDGEVSIWSIFKKKPLHTIKNAHGISQSSREPNWIVSIGAIPNTEVFASGSSDGFVKLWSCSDDLRGASPLLDIPVIGFANSLSFSSDGKLLAIGVGQEHRLGRWQKIPDAKNSIFLINLHRKGEKGIEATT